MPREFGLTEQELMAAHIGYHHRMPQESYSRILDAAVQMSEYPYGYTTPPPPADSGIYDKSHMESKKQYPMREVY